MATEQRPAGPPRDQRSLGWTKAVRITAGSLAVLALCVGCSSGGNSTVVPAPTDTERRETVTVLQRSAEAQDFCYGWRLSDSAGDVVSVGSNLGDNVAVDTDPARCPRWVEVAADVTYTDASSELEDSATVRVNSSSESLGEYDLVDGLTQLGLGNDAFLDEPGWAICRAAVSLPLLMAEAGHAKPAPVATVTPSAPSTPLADAGSDFARDRGGYVIAAFLLFVLTAVLVTIGWFQRRRELAVRPTPPDRTPPVPGTPTTNPSTWR
jgi:hypothetical protein